MMAPAVDFSLCNCTANNLCTRHAEAEFLFAVPASKIALIEPQQPKPRQVLAVEPNGQVRPEELRTYIAARQQEVARRLRIVLDNAVVQKWLAEFSETSLYKEDKQYLGDPSAEQQTLAALHRFHIACQMRDACEMTAAVEEFIHFFCGFHTIKAKSLINAVHFQFAMDVPKLLSTTIMPPSAGDAPSQDVRDLFDASEIVSAELLLRAVVETADGSLIANCFSPGRPMGSLLKLPFFAQLVMVLTNVVEAIWYQQDNPDCPMSINAYASLLVEGAPILEMIDGVTVVEVMEMTKGAKRGPEVVHWVKTIREQNIEVLLDDFDSKHPGMDSSPNGIKVCVFANAFHSLQAFNDDGASSDMAVVEKEQVNDMDFKDYYCSLVPRMKEGIQKLIMEGSENCLKSEVRQGPPLNFDEPQATTATAHVYQAAARSLIAWNPNLQMLHQGGRALYDDEEFDEDARAVIQNLSKPLPAARKGDAGTMAWIGDEAKRRAAMKVRPLASGVMKKTV